jgi:hypothetical protein
MAAFNLASKMAAELSFQSYRVHWFILTHPANLPCGRKPEHLEETHDFRQSFDRLFSHEFVARIQRLLWLLRHRSLLLAIPQTSP